MHEPTLGKRNSLLVVSTVLLLALIVGACGPADSSTETLIVLIDNDEGPITPANFNTFIGYYMGGWVYDQLFVRSTDLISVPALGTEANQSEDGLTWEVKLREDVKWHDGEPFTADDVVFTYNWLKAAGRAPALEVMDSIQANGEHGVTISLQEPSPFFLDEALAQYYIMPEHIWKDQEPVSGELSQFQGKIGTGPYKLLEIVPGESYTFEANPDYYRGEPQVQNLIAKIVKDRTQQFNQLKAGDASAVLSSVPPSLVEELSGTEGIDLAQGSDFFNYVFYANGSRPPFDNPKARQAIALAIDAQKLVDTVMLGQGILLPVSYYHPDLPWAINIPGEYDPEAAKALLDEAGLVDSDGDGIREINGEPASYEVLCDVNNAVEVRSTELIVDMLKDVGIQSEQRCMDIDTAVTYIWPSFVAVPDPEYDLGIWGWSSAPQIQRGFLRFLTNCNLEEIGWANLTGTCDPMLDELFAEYVTNPDPARQEELAGAIQEQFAETMVFIPVMSPGGNFAYRPADYDGWQYMKGTGIMTLWSFLPEDAAE
jgi:peptide/nickel transport system substrate-binding protein